MHSVSSAMPSYTVSFSLTVADLAEELAAGMLWVIGSRRPGISTARLFSHFVTEMTYWNHFTKSRNGYFQQDSATVHIDNETLELIREIFEDRVTSLGMWPPWSPDLTVCDFHLWGYLKNKVYVRNPHTLDELKNYIRREINLITAQQLTRGNLSFMSRCRICVDVERHFQHLLS